MLGIHVNTVRQRLASAQALIGDWRDGSRALEIHVALRLWHVGVGVGQGYRKAYRARAAARRIGPFALRERRWSAARASDGNHSPSMAIDC